MNDVKHMGSVDLICKKENIMYLNMASLKKTDLVLSASEISHKFMPYELEQDCFFISFTFSEYMRC